MQKYNVFLSWSGDRSKWVATALRDWLPLIVQAAKPWISNKDIDRGARSAPELEKSLEGTKIGITCLTPENLDAPWILYEAGKLTKTIDDKTRLCTYLLAGLRPSDIKAPLGWFQHTESNEMETLALMQSINKAVSDDPRPESHIEKLFAKPWPELEEKLKTMPAAEEAKVPKRSAEDMVSEILDILRSDVSERAELKQFLDRRHSYERLYSSITGSTIPGTFPGNPLSGALGWPGRPPYSEGLYGIRSMADLAGAPDKSDNPEQEEKSAQESVENPVKKLKQRRRDG